MEDRKQVTLLLERKLPNLQAYLTSASKYLPESKKELAAGDDEEKQLRAGE